MNRYIVKGQLPFLISDQQIASLEGLVMKLKL